MLHSLHIRYQRPELVTEGYSADEVTAFASHFNRPVITPRTAALPEGVGYAEAINAGKSKHNEDQATVIEGRLVGMNGVAIPYLYVGLFDGHGGAGCAIKVSKELHAILHEGLEDVLPYMAFPEKMNSPTPNGSNNKNGMQRRGSEGIKNGNGAQNGADSSSDEEKEAAECEDDDETVEVAMNLDELVCGALESSFWAMDRLILRDKETHKIVGGCTATVALFICGKLYVANAGDSRAGVCLRSLPQFKPLSSDFTPESDRQRIQHIAFQRPELLRCPHTKEKLYNRHILSRKVTKEDIGISIMYKDFYMTGWSCRDVTSDDVKLMPIISGRGKQCRVLNTVGVARGLGDHDLLAKYSGVKCKEFLTPQPEVQIIDLSSAELGTQDALVMGTDGLWDVLSNEDVMSLWTEEMSTKSNLESKFQDLSKKLVATARGDRAPEMYWELKNKKLASGDDISAIVVGLRLGKRVLSEGRNR